MNFGIGTKEGKLLYHLPKDLRHFKSITKRKHVVMGRKTWESLPTKPLPDRKNYVLTMDENYKAEGATVVTDIADIYQLALSEEVYIIGGTEIYYQFIDEADELIITHVHHVHQGAFAHFPDFDYKEWKQEGKLHKHEIDKEHSQEFTFARYVRKD